MTARRTATRRGGAATGLLGLGAAACAACCAGPILGLLGAIGIASAAGYTFVGSVALVIGAAVAATAVLRRRAHDQPVLPSTEHRRDGGRSGGQDHASVRRATRDRA